MKTAPPQVVSYLNANNVAWLADIYTVTLLSGAVYRWTTADFDIVWNGNAYLANGAVLGRGNAHTEVKLKIDSTDIELSGLVQLGGTAIALLAIQGAFDEARVQVDHFVGPDARTAIGWGPIQKWWEGRVAGIDPRSHRVRVAVESELGALNKMLPGFTFQAQCGNIVYDANCTLAKAPLTLTGTVSGSPTVSAIPTATAAVTAKAAGYFNLGVLAFTSGALSGVRRSIKNWDGTTFTPYRPFPSAPAAGDAFSVFPGCRRDKASCNAFGNLVNFRGFPHIPIPEGGK
jgi:uncharacterized phage protein (TIGR02218 family)